jgi:hypothetical protein
MSKISLTTTQQRLSLAKWAAPLSLSVDDGINVKRIPPAQRLLRLWYNRHWRNHPMLLTDYIQAAMRRARYEILSDGAYYGEIPGFQGVYASAATLEDCRQILQESS